MNESGKKKQGDGNKPQSEQNGQRFRVPPEKTGLTPEEEAYVPRTESRPLPRSVFALLTCVLLLAFAGGGIFYYHSAIHPERQYQKATRLFENEHYEEALALYQKALRNRPERRGTLFQIASCYEKLGRDTEAAVSFARHLEAAPRDTNALLRLGNVYLRLGQFENALAPFENMAKISPDNAETRHSLGKIYEKLASTARAADNYELALKSDKADPELLLSASKSLMGLGRYESALRGYERAQGAAEPGDNRASHGAKAAKNMLGWPTDPAIILVPGKSLGALEIGMSEADILKRLGEPEEKETKETGHTESVARENWIYSNRNLIVFFSNGRVLQILTKLEKYRTQTGLGIANFQVPKYEDRFNRWRDSDTENPGSRYILKGGGLAFYASNGNLAAIVYRGEFPPTDGDQDFWRKIEPDGGE